MWYGIIPLCLYNFTRENFVSCRRLMVLTFRKIIDNCCIFAMKITSCFLDRLENAYFLSCYGIKYMFWIYFGSKIKNIHFWFFLSLPGRFFSSIFQSQNKMMFVFWPFLAPNIAPHPKHKISVFLNMLVWLMKISSVQKLKKNRLPFLATKHIIKIHIRYVLWSETFIL